MVEETKGAYEKSKMRKKKLMTTIVVLMLLILGCGEFLMIILETYLVGNLVVCSDIGNVGYFIEESMTG